jgi:hypothetical protein
MTSHRPSRSTAPMASGSAERDGFKALDARLGPSPRRSAPRRAAWDSASGDARRADWQAIGLQQVIRAGAVAKRRSAVHQQVTAKVPEPHSAAAASEPATSEAASKGAGRRGDRLDRHFAPALAERLRRAALETLGDVATADTSGREWWAMAPGIGPLRAREIADRYPWIGPVNGRRRMWPLWALMPRLSGSSASL